MWCGTGAGVGARDRGRVRVRGWMFGASGKIHQEPKRQKADRMVGAGLEVVT